MIERQNNFEDNYSNFLRLHKGEYKLELPSFENFLQNLTEEDFKYYPNMKAAYNALDHHLSLEYDECIIGEGSDRVIKYFFEVLHQKVKNLIVPEPAFPMYKVYGFLYNLNVISIPYDPINDNLQDTLNEAFEKYTDSIFCISNPHSPYGEELDLQKLATNLKKNNSYLLEDRAYYSKIHDKDLSFKENDRILVCYTFSKYFGAAGLRLGLGIANKQLMSEIKQWRSMYECSNIAIKYISYYFENAVKFKNYYKTVQQNKKDIIKFLNRFNTFTIFSANQMPWFFIRNNDYSAINVQSVHYTYDKNIKMYKFDVCELDKMKHIL